MNMWEAIVHVITTEYPYFCTNIIRRLLKCCIYNFVFKLKALDEGQKERKKSKMKTNVTSKAKQAFVPLFHQVVNKLCS